MEKKKVLLVEDEVFLVKALNIKLLENGFEVSSALDGEAALHITKQEKPDIILLDMLLPKIHGMEVLKNLKTDPETSHIPVLILSNSSEKEQCLEALKLGAEDYFIKSNADLDVIIKKITSILHEKTLA